MAGEFYRKSAALYEEFKKRELHFYNMERSISNNYSSHNDISLPLKDYIERLNQREKEAERLYGDLLSRIEKMDRSTDQMSLKLEKLNALRNVAFSSSYTSWPVNNTFDKSSSISYANAFQQSASTSSYFPSFHDKTMFNNLANNFTSSALNSRTVSTQTEHVFCEKCHYPVTRFSNSNISATNIESTSVREQNSEEHITDSLLYLPDQDLGHLVNANVSNTEHIIKNRTVGEGFTENFPLTINTNQNNHKQVEQSENAKQGSNQGFVFTEIPQMSPLLENPQSLLKETRQSNYDVDRNEKFTSVIPSLTSNDCSISSNNRITSHPKELLVSQNALDTSVVESPISNGNLSLKDSEDDNTLYKSEMLEKAASKSDEGSINHEFNFLESDRETSVKKEADDCENQISASSNLPENKNIVKVHESSLLENKSIEKVDSAPEGNINSTAKNLKTSDSLLVSEDAKLDSSYSEGLPSPGHQSADVSNHSESESLSEQETPFTASAAYQALLGNIAPTKEKQKVPSPSDSDSADEIENVLATAVRKASKINFDAVLQVQKKDERKQSILEVDPKSEKKNPKPVSIGNPQNKLAKNTRKVLGLDTSSGSEMESEVKQNATKIEEDSDEFDFYN